MILFNDAVIKKRFIHNFMRIYITRTIHENQDHGTSSCFICITLYDNLLLNINCILLMHVIFIWCLAVFRVSRQSCALRFCVLMCVFLLSSCFPIAHHTHGHISHKKQPFSSVKEGMSMQTVQEHVGQPTFTDPFAPLRWFYVHYETAHQLFFKPKLRSEHKYIYVIQFNEDGYVKSVINDHNMHLPIPRTEMTPPPTYRENILERLLTQLKMFGKSPDEQHKSSRKS